MRGNCVIQADLWIRRICESSGSANRADPCLRQILQACLHAVKCVDGFAFQMLAGAEHRGREALAVHGVREELSLQGDSVAVAEDLAAVTLPGGQEVAGVDLHSGQIREDPHADAGAGRGEDSGVQAGQDVAVVVAAAIVKLDIVRLNIPADGLFRPEIEGRSFHRKKLSCGQAVRIVLAETVRIDSQKMIQDGTFAFQIEVGMVRQADQGVLVGVRVVADAEGIVRGQGEGDADRQVSGEVFFSVRRETGEDNGISGCPGCTLYSVLRRNSFSLPEAFVKAPDAAVEAVAVVVVREAVGLSVQGKLRAADAVSDAAYRRAEKAVAGTTSLAMPCRRSSASVPAPHV